MNLQTFLGWLVPDVEDARAAASALRSENPGWSDEALARLAVARARRLGMTAGATTGVFASPLTIVPAAAADAAAILKIEGTLVGTVAGIMDPAVLTSPEAFRADVMGIVFPGVASQALRALGVRSAKEFTRDLIRKNVGKNVVEQGLKWSARYFGVAMTRKALMTKLVPLVGAGVGGGWNWVEVGAVGQRAIQYYQDKPIGAKSADPARRRKTVVSRVRRVLGLPGPVGRSAGVPPVS